jgi:hypothetical protein
MTTRTWIGGNDGNAAASAANWSPTGAPQPGDDLTIATGTIEIGGRLKGDTLHLTDQALNDGPVTLDLDGNARVSIDGSRITGDPLNINVHGTDYLDASVQVGGGTFAGGINLADHSHLFLTGSMRFAYGGQITGGVGSKLTNNGTLDLGSRNSPLGTPNLIHPLLGTVSTPINGDGELVFHGYHDGQGYAGISAPVAASQTIELSPEFFGLQMTLGDPGDFHGLLKIDPPRGSHDVDVVVKGVVADNFSVRGNNVLLTDGGRPVDLLRVANAGSMQITPTFAPDATMLTFHGSSTVS